MISKGHKRAGLLLKRALHKVLQSPQPRPCIDGPDCASSCLPAAFCCDRHMCLGAVPYIFPNDTNKVACNQQLHPMQLRQAFATPSSPVDPRACYRLQMLQ